MYCGEEKILVVLDLDETLLHQHTKDKINHSKLCTHGWESGMLENDSLMDNFVHFCIREGVLEFLAMLEKQRKEGKLDILIWTKMPKPNSVAHLVTLAHHAGISSHVGKIKGDKGFTLEGKGDIYNWGLISREGSMKSRDIQSPNVYDTGKDLRHLLDKQRLLAMYYSLNNKDEFDKGSYGRDYPIYWKHGFNTDAILQNVKSGKYGTRQKNICIFDDKYINCMTKEEDGISINVPAFRDQGDDFFQRFVCLLNRFVKLEITDKNFFRSKFVETATIMKQMIEQRKIKCHEKRETKAIEREFDLLK